MVPFWLILRSQDRKHWVFVAKMSSILTMTVLYFLQRFPKFGEQKSEIMFKEPARKSLYSSYFLGDIIYIAYHYYTFWLRNLKPLNFRMATLLHRIHAAYIIYLHSKQSWVVKHFVHCLVHTIIGIATGAWPQYSGCDWSWNLETISKTWKN